MVVKPLKLLGLSDIDDDHNTVWSNSVSRRWLMVVMNNGDNDDDDDDD